MTIRNGYSLLLKESVYMDHQYIVVIIQIRYWKAVFDLEYISQYYYR